MNRFPTRAGHLPPPVKVCRSECPAAVPEEGGGPGRFMYLNRILNAILDF